MEHKVRIHATIHALKPGFGLSCERFSMNASHKRRVQIMRRNLTRDPWHPLPWHTFRVVPGQTRRDLTRIADHSRLLAHCCDLMRIADHSRLLAQCVPATMRPCAHASLLGSSLAHPQRIPRSLLAASSLIQGTSSHPCIAQASSFLHPGLYMYVSSSPTTSRCPPSCAMLSALSCFPSCLLLTACTSAPRSSSSRTTSR